MINRKEDLQRTIQTIQKILDGQQRGHTKIMWDESISRYLRVIERVNMDSQRQELSGWVPFNDSILGGMNTFIEKCRNPEFHIAFVGTIKAGKSTLINAILKQDIASVDVTPETAALTKFRATSNKDFVRLVFYTSEEWELVWQSVQANKEDKTRQFFEDYQNLNADAEKQKWLDHSEIVREFEDSLMLKTEVAKWTSSKQPTHYFVKQVEVGLTNCALPEKVTFVDTPGLDDPVTFRSDITKQYIARANAVLVCVRSAALTGQDLGTIYKVFSNTRYNPEKVYIIGTQTDALNEPEIDWQRQIQEWLKFLKEDGCYNSIELARRNLMGVSAYLYNFLLRYHELEQSQKRKLASIALNYGVDSNDIDKRIDELFEVTRINQLRDKLTSEIIQKHKQLYVRELQKDYSDLKSQLLPHLEKVKNIQVENLKLADEKVETIQGAVSKKQGELEEQMHELSVLREVIQNVRELTKKQADRLHTEITQIRSAL